VTSCAATNAALDQASRSKRKFRSFQQKLKDFVAFPLRALWLFEQDKWGLTALASERFDYVAREVRGRCLDVGCGRRNRFVREFVGDTSVGIDVFPYEGLAKQI